MENQQAKRLSHDADEHGQRTIGPLFGSIIMAEYF